MLPTRDLSTPTGPLPLTVMGFGGAPLGNMYTAISDADAGATLDAAWDAGTARVRHGASVRRRLSEERFGRALAARDRGATTCCRPRSAGCCATAVLASHRRATFVNTPRRTFDYDYSYDGVMRSHDASLRRLGQDRVDILFVHDVDVMSHGSRERVHRARARALRSRWLPRARGASCRGRGARHRRRRERVGSVRDAAGPRRLRLLSARRALHACSSRRRSPRSCRSASGAASASSSAGRSTQAFLQPGRWMARSTTTGPRRQTSSIESRASRRRARRTV